MLNEKDGKSYPFAVEELTPEENEKITDMIIALKQDYVRVGPVKCLMGKSYLSKAAEIYNFPLRPDDIFIITHPKSGTTMTQELIWLICNDLNYEAAQQNLLNERFPYLEMSALLPEDQIIYTENQISELKKYLLPATVDDIIDMPSPRFIKTHVPMSLLPPSLLDKTKVVYVARDPRDVAVSLYHHYKLMNFLVADCEFKDFWNYVVNDYMAWGPSIAHVLEAWKQRNHPNMLFLYYEEITKDMPGTIRRVADFFGKKISDEQVEELARHLNIDNFKKNKSVNWEQLKESGLLNSDGAFIRKGKAGGWRDHFDEEMAAQAENWIAKYLHGTDFTFPTC